MPSNAAVAFVLQVSPRPAEDVPVLRLTLTTSRAMLGDMSKVRSVAGFTSGERGYIRRELDMFFSTYPNVAEGFQLKTWRGGPLAGQPKLSPAVKRLLERGPMRMVMWLPFSRLFFTDAGLKELRSMMGHRRLADLVKFSHVRAELGITNGPETTVRGVERATG